eukprot:TRINITY_DN10519_c0_g1_i1.p2 TRINITY_DN10519_c0_g1~~TRINITY_DN10519_c0_g1_i1.p2  ORF type:complete len:281 (+),score=121.25 TRINITY_DN10519_c0_g1_i1:81-923(+)
MLQVDVFWSFAIGGIFAHCAGDALTKHPSAYENWYFVYTIMFLSLVFAPSGAYLLSRNPGWESMFVFNRESFGVHRWEDAAIPAFFAHTNVSLGLFGFLAVRALNRAGMRWAGTFLWHSAYSVMFAILGMGYGRFLYPGTTEDWAARKEYTLKDVPFSDIFNALLVMSVVFVPTLLVPQLSWLSRVSSNVVAKDRAVIIGSYFFSLAAQSVLFMAYINYFGEEESHRIRTGFGMRIPVAEARFGAYAPLVVSAIFTTLTELIFIGPLIAATGTVPKEKLR